MSSYRPWVGEIKLTQAADSCAPNDILQHLSVTIADAGAGHYVILKTGRWAMDVDELFSLAKHLKGLCDDADKAMDKAMRSTDFPGADLFPETR